MDRLAAATTPGADETWAFLGPDRMNMAAVGMRTGGFLFPVPITHSEVGRGHLVRASLESTAFAVKANLEQIDQITGVRPRTITVGGGMTRTATWVRVLVDVLGRDIGVSYDPNVSATGASLCARTALGDYASLAEAAASRRHAVTDIEPEQPASAEYEDLYERWTELSGRLRSSAV